MTYAFRNPPERPGSTDCDACYGLGWTLDDGAVSRCSPCGFYESDAAAAVAAASTVKHMYVKLNPGEQLITGHGYEPFVLHPLAEPAESCPDCGGDFFSVEAGYDRYGWVTLEKHLLVIEDDNFSEEGGGPLYLYCSGCQKSYVPPDGTTEHR